MKTKNSMPDYHITTADLVEMIHNKFNRNIYATISAVNNFILQLDNGAEFFKMSLQSELAMLAELYNITLENNLKKEVHTMSPYDLFEIIHNNTNGSVRRTIENVNEFIEELKNNKSNFVNGLSEILTDYAISNERCPICGEQLTVQDRWSELRGEYFGTPSHQKHQSFGCGSCSL